MNENRFKVLSHEDQAAFDRLLEAYRTEFTPKTVHEKFLVEEMAQARWRLDRTRLFESLALDQILTGEFDKTNPNARIVAKLAENCRDILTFLQRYATAAERTYHRAHRELTQARSRELRNKANQAQVWLKHQILQTPVREDTWSNRSESGTSGCESRHNGPGPGASDQ